MALAFDALPAVAAPAEAAPPEPAPAAAPPTLPASAPAAAPASAPAPAPPALPTGRLRIRLEYTGAALFVDGVAVDRKTAFDGLELKPGRHVLTAKAPGFAVTKALVVVKADVTKKRLVTMMGATRALDDAWVRDRDAFLRSGLTLDAYVNARDLDRARKRVRTGLIGGIVGLASASVFSTLFALSIRAGEASPFWGFWAISSFGVGSGLGLMGLGNHLKAKRLSRPAGDEAPAPAPASRTPDFDDVP